MLNQSNRKNNHYSEEKRQLIEEQKARWRSVNYGETSSNLANYKRQVESFGRIKVW
tara:strand:+ start:21 stop:188 length:168 start_codon:yes stop_codon:yes gene_type:complete